MGYLLTASVIWAFSFGLIQHKLVGVGLNPFVVALARLLLSLLMFLPLLRPHRIPFRLGRRLVLLGTVQYGVMYVAYLASYRFLASHEVALFTIFTPIYVTLIHDAIQRRFRRLHLLTAMLAVAGTGVIVAAGRDAGAALTGVLVLQISNVSFAFGQVIYRHLMNAEARRSGGNAPRDVDVFGLLYLGGTVFAALPVLFTGAWSGIALSGGQILTLLYLGFVPSGLCFFLWNRGARRVDAGTLAVMNNAKIPLAVLCSLILFGERTAWWPLLLGGGVLLASVWLSERFRRAGASAAPRSASRLRPR